MVNEWKPIETAPKNEFELILLAERYPNLEKIDGDYCRCGIRYETRVGFWVEEKQGFFSSEVLSLMRKGKIAGQGHEIRRATYWMELPNPPETVRQGSK